MDFIFPLDNILVYNYLGFTIFFFINTGGFCLFVICFLKGVDGC